MAENYVTRTRYDADKDRMELDPPPRQVEPPPSGLEGVQFSTMPDGSLELWDQGSGQKIVVRSGPVFDALSQLADSKTGSVKAVDPGMTSLPPAGAPPPPKVYAPPLDAAGNVQREPSLAEDTIGAVRKAMKPKDAPPPKVATGDDDDDTET